MPDHDSSFETLAISLGAAPADAKWWVGCVHGFPVALIRLNTSAEPPPFGPHLDPATRAAVLRDLPAFGVLFQIRFPPQHNPSTITVDSIHWNKELTAALATNSVKLSLDAGAAWLEIDDAGNRMRDDGVIRLLDAVLDGLTGAGVDDSKMLCHYCGIRNASVRFAEGHVARICDPCSEERTAPLDELPGAAGRRLVSLILAAVAGIPLSASIWVGFWYAHQWMIWKIVGNTSTKVYVPHFMELMWFGVTSLLAAVPLMLCMQAAKIPSRATACATAIFLVLATCGVGAAFVARRFQISPIEHDMLIYLPCTAVLMGSFVAMVAMPRKKRPLAPLIRQPRIPDKFR